MVNSFFLNYNKQKTLISINLGYALLTVIPMLELYLLDANVKYDKKSGGENQSLLDLPTDP